MTRRWSFLFLLKFPGWLSLVVEIEYSKDEEQGLSFLKSFDDQVGKFDLCVRRLPPSIWHIGLFSRVPAAKTPSRKRWGLGEEKPARAHPLSSRLRRNSALRGRTSGPKRWRSLVQHLIELLRGRSAVPLRRFFSKEQGAGHPSAKDVSVLFTALARPYFGRRWLFDVLALGSTWSHT